MTFHCFYGCYLCQNKFLGNEKTPDTVKTVLHLKAGAREEFIFHCNACHEKFNDSVDTGRMVDPVKASNGEGKNIRAKSEYHSEVGGQEDHSGVLGLHPSTDSSATSDVDKSDEPTLRAGRAQGHPVAEIQARFAPGGIYSYTDDKEAKPSASITDRPTEPSRPLSREKTQMICSATLRVEDDGVTVYADDKGVDVAWKLPTGGVVDQRINPPFLTISPCPYCDAVNDKGHDPLKHIASYLGTKVKEVK